MEDLTNHILENLDCLARSCDMKLCGSGVTTVDTLAGGPPSVDLTYALPTAKSAVSFALALDQSLIADYLSKKSRLVHERDNLSTNTMASGIALQMAKYLESYGYRSIPIVSNAHYRYEERDVNPGAMYPDISLRYLAVRSGVGFFGKSGNVLTKEEGAAVILGAFVTEAELVPTEPLPEEANYCDECGLCTKVCAFGYMDSPEKSHITLGGVDFTYTKRLPHNRCNATCGGFNGLHPSGKWSTWSPGRLKKPKTDEDVLPILAGGLPKWFQWPAFDEGGVYHSLMHEKKLLLTCGNCQLICHPDKEERSRRYKLLTTSGVVVQNEDGSLEAVPPEEAEKRLAAMNPERRALYESVKGEP